MEYLNIMLHTQI